MSELKKAVQNLRKAIDYYLPLQADFSIKSDIEKLAALIDNKIGNSIIQADEEEKLKVILQKLSLGESLTKREKGEIPFVIYRKECDDKIFGVGLRQINYANKLHIKRLLYMYFLNYDISYKTIKIGEYLQLVAQRSQFQSKNELLKKAMDNKFHELFFTPDCMKNMAIIISKFDKLANVYRFLNFPTILLACNFIKEALRTYFKDKNFQLEQQYTYFQCISKDKSYVSIYPNAVNGLILKIHDLKSVAQSKYKEDAIKLFCKVMGDPRFDNKNLQWNGVSKKAREIFLQWLAENDLNLFFKIIDKTGVDSMWKYRKNFWYGYLKYISKTWVFLGKEASELARKLDYNNYGELKKGESKHSVLAFQIGKYVFIEWSHNGKLRVWEADEAPDVFGKREVDREKIVYSFPEKEWVHAGKENDGWQSRVRDWINEYVL